MTRELGPQIRDWLRVLEVPVPDLCFTMPSTIAFQATRSVEVAKKRDRHLEDSEPVPLFRHESLAKVRPY